MEEIEKSEAEIVELLMEEEYSDICADLITDRGREKFLQLLGSQKSGTWIEAASLTGGLSESLLRLKTLEAQQDYRLHVMWAEHPEDPINYCVILFFLSSTLWSYGAVTRKENLHS